MFAHISNYNNRHLHTKQRQLQKEFLESVQYSLRNRVSDYNYIYDPQLTIS